MTGSHNTGAGFLLSVLVKDSRKEVVIYKAVFDEYDLFSNLKQLLMALANDGSDLPELKKNFNEVMNAFIKRFKSEVLVKEIVAGVSKLVSETKVLKMDQLMGKMKAMETEFLYAYQRLKDMQGAAKSEYDLQIIRGRLSGELFENVLFEKCIDVEGELGWRFLAVR